MHIIMEIHQASELNYIDWCISNFNWSFLVFRRKFEIFTAHLQLVNTQMELARDNVTRATNCNGDSIILEHSENEAIYRQLI